MKKAWIGVLSGLLLMTAWMAYPNRSQAAEKESTVIEGILVDTKCYAMDTKNLSNDHDTKAGKMVNCGTACAATGIPVGIVEGGKAGGKVYILLVPSRMLADHVGKTARVTGRVALGNSLLVDNLEVKEKDGSYKMVEIVTMM